MRTITIGTTERSQFKRCRRMWDYSSFSRQSLQPIFPPTALSLGRLVHAALAEWLVNPEDHLPSIYARVADTFIETAKETHRTQVGVEPLAIELAGTQDVIALGAHMMDNYQKYYGTPLKPGWTLVAPEQQVVVPIPGERYYFCEQCQEIVSIAVPYEEEDIECQWCGSTIKASPVYLECTFDGLIRDEDGQLFILEHKTYNARPQEDALRTNDQFLSYMWAVKQMFGEYAGLAYDGMWKRKVPPKYKTMDDLFLRLIFRRPPEEFEEFAQELEMEARDMLNPQIAIYKNRKPECLWDCYFHKLCLAQSRGEDTDLVRRAHYTRREKDLPLWEEPGTVPELTH